MTISLSTPVPPVRIPLLDTLDQNTLYLLNAKRLFIFLDYDGTLTPIVSVPSEAKLSCKMRDILLALVDTFEVGIVTGRGRVAISGFLAENLIQKVSLAASHGFDIRLRNGEQLQIGDSNQISNFGRFKSDLKSIEFPTGVTIEETTFSISVHYRQAIRMYSRIESILDDLLGRYEGLIRTEGKMVFEVRLDIDWNKGKAIEYILSTHTCTLDEIFVIYIGDDITDEDGFQSVNKYPNHLSIIVAPDEDIGRATCAEFRLADPDQVASFLKSL